MPSMRPPFAIGGIRSRLSKGGSAKRLGSECNLGSLAHCWQGRSTRLASGSERLLAGLGSS